MFGEIVSFEVKKDSSNPLTVFYDGSELNEIEKNDLGFVLQHFLSGESRENSDGDRGDIIGEINRMTIPGLTKSEISQKISNESAQYANGWRTGSDGTGLPEMFRDVINKIRFEIEMNKVLKQGVHIWNFPCASSFSGESKPLVSHDVNHIVFNIIQSKGFCFKFGEESEESNFLLKTNSQEHGDDELSNYNYQFILKDDGSSELRYTLDRRLWDILNSQSVLGLLNKMYLISSEQDNTEFLNYFNELYFEAILLVLANPEASMKIGFTGEDDAQFDSDFSSRHDLRISMQDFSKEFVIRLAEKYKDKRLLSFEDVSLISDLLINYKHELTQKLESQSLESQSLESQGENTKYTKSLLDLLSYYSKSKLVVLDVSLFQDYSSFLYLEKNFGWYMCTQLWAKLKNSEVNDCRAVVDTHMGSISGLIEVSEGANKESLIKAQSHLAVFERRFNVLQKNTTRQDIDVENGDSLESIIDSLSPI